MCWPELCRLVQHNCIELDCARRGWNERPTDFWLVGYGSVRSAGRAYATLPARRSRGIGTRAARRFGRFRRGDYAELDAKIRGFRPRLIYGLLFAAVVWFSFPVVALANSGPASKRQNRGGGRRRRRRPKENARLAPMHPRARGRTSWGRRRGRSQPHGLTISRFDNLITPDVQFKRGSHAPCTIQLHRLKPELRGDNLRGVEVRRVASGPLTRLTRPNGGAYLRRNGPRRGGRTGRIKRWRSLKHLVRRSQWHVFYFHGGSLSLELTQDRELIRTARSNEKVTTATKTTIAIAARVSSNAAITFRASACCPRSACAAHSDALARPVPRPAPSRLMSNWATMARRLLPTVTSEGSHRLRPCRYTPPA
jgi:hypothetical protein